MFCPNCGKVLSDKAAICPGCGANVEGANKKISKKASAGWWWLGFFLPTVGLLIWALCNDSDPAKAKKAGIGALVGFILSIVAVILFYALMIIVPLAALNYGMA